MDIQWGVVPGQRSLEHQYRDRPRHHGGQAFNVLMEGWNVKTTTTNWFVGIDWATKEHAVCLLDEAGKVLGERAFPHSGAGIAELCEWLFAKTGTEDARSFHAAIEMPHGAVVETLLERGMNVYSINPKQLDRFRDRFTVAGAKDDRRDARVLADSLRTDRACFRVLKVDAPLLLQLRESSRIRDEIQEDRIRLSNRLGAHLQRYFPQYLELASDIARDWFLDLWQLIPTPAAARRVRATTVATLLNKRKIRTVTAKEVLEVLRQKPLTVAPGIVEATQEHIETIIERLRVVNQLLKRTLKRLDKLIALLSTAVEDGTEGKREQRDVMILRSLPGVGRIILAALLAEATQPLAARDYQALRSLSGVAPVTKSSGKRSGPRAVVVMRYACNLRLREAVHHWARIAMKVDPKSKKAYADLRDRGKTHGRALRTVADRLLNVACAMLRSGALYDPARRQLPAAA